MANLGQRFQSCRPSFLSAVTFFFSYDNTERHKTELSGRPKPAFCSVMSFKFNQLDSKSLSFDKNWPHLLRFFFSSTLIAFSIILLCACTHSLCRISTSMLLIHFSTSYPRSKRKVLGRKESEEDKSRTGCHPQSPPVTPTAMSPGSVSSLPRQTGSIQRNLRKSSTSSDTFKALLLKKGSRSETSFRMSATEMLRSTDPRFQRTRSESELDPPAASPSSPTAPHSPLTSPGRGKRATDEWNRYDAFSLSSPTSSSFSMSGLKYGRSRTPPSAASSKYNARSRILSSPMTVICEREGELAESEYGDTAESLSGPAAQTLPVLKDSNGTLSEESRS